MLLVPPAFLVARKGAQVSVHDVLRGASIELEGAAADAVSSGTREPCHALDTLSRFESTGTLAALRDGVELRRLWPEAIDAIEAIDA